MLKCTTFNIGGGELTGKGEVKEEEKGRKGRGLHHGFLGGMDAPSGATVRFDKNYQKEKKYIISAGTYSHSAI